MAQDGPRDMAGLAALKKFGKVSARPATGVKRNKRTLVGKRGNPRTLSAAGPGFTGSRWVG